MEKNKSHIKNDIVIKNKVGSGTYGDVFQGYRNTDKNMMVSIKQTKKLQDDRNIPSAVLRELVFINEINHTNIVHISTKDVYVDTEEKILSFVYEYGACDIRKIVRFYGKKRMNMSHLLVKSVLFQLLLALDHLHKRSIVHCDVTPTNLIVMPHNSPSQGVLKLIDFGLSRTIEAPNQNHSIGVVTVWYRAPEILLGDAKYDTAVDLWSAGCIFAELLTGKILFQTENQNQEKNPTVYNKLQLDKLIEIMGPIRSEDIARPDDCSHLNEYRKRPPNNSISTLSSLFKDVPGSGFDLLAKLLTYNPKHRITAHEALRHPFFNERPIPTVNIAKIFPPDEWDMITKYGDGTSQC